MISQFPRREYFYMTGMHDRAVPSVVHEAFLHTARVDLREDEKFSKRPLKR